jgi:hypothetical protein
MVPGAKLLQQQGIVVGKGGAEDVAGEEAAGPHPVRPMGHHFGIVSILVLKITVKLSTISI